MRIFSYEQCKNVCLLLLDIWQFVHCIEKGSIVLWTSMGTWRNASLKDFIMWLRLSNSHPIIFMFLPFLKTFENRFRDSNKFKWPLKRKKKEKCLLRKKSYKLDFMMGVPVVLESRITHDDQIYFICKKVRWVC